MPPRTVRSRNARIPRPAVCRRACVMIAAASSAGNGGTVSCSLASSSAMSLGSRSLRVEIAWPNFTKIGPSSSSASRSAFAERCRRVAPSRQQVKEESERAEQMRLTDDFVESMTHEHTLDADDPRQRAAPAHVQRSPEDRSSFAAARSTPSRSVDPAHWRSVRTRNGWARRGSLPGDIRAGCPSWSCAPRSPTP